MRRVAVALGCLACLFAAGCCMCAAPYDYCAPTFTGQPGEDCRPHARVNSAFSYGPVGDEPTPIMGEMATPTEVQGSGELPTAAAPNQRPFPAPPPASYSALRNR